MKQQQIETWENAFQIVNSSIHKGITHVATVTPAEFHSGAYFAQDAKQLISLLPEKVFVQMLNNLFPTDNIINVHVDRERKIVIFEYHPKKEVAEE